LEFWKCDEEPTCLLPMTTGLTMLHLEDVNLQPRQAQQDGALGASQLLRLLARLRALEVLMLKRVRGTWPEQQLSAHSALTASSKLQRVRLEAVELQGAAWVQRGCTCSHQATRFTAQHHSFCRLWLFLPSLWGTSCRRCFDSHLTQVTCRDSLGCNHKRANSNQHI
jgi:hypothetical protein